MDEYEVITRMAELPGGSQFLTIPEFPLRTGTLALFDVGDSTHEHLIIGRWFPDICGSHWILQASRWIRIAKEAAIRIIGRIVPAVDGNFKLDWIIQTGMIVAGASLAVSETLQLITPLIAA